MLSLGTCILQFVFNSIDNYVPILAPQHNFKLYLCRCFIRLKCKYARGAMRSAKSEVDRKPPASEDKQCYELFLGNFKL